MHNWDERECSLDEAPCAHDRRSVSALEVKAGTLHFILSNSHFVANGFVFARLGRTMM